MNQHLTDLTLIVDRSGSMESIRGDAEGGINAFIAKQKELPGECNLTLVEFDTAYDFVHKAVPIAKAGKYTLMPRGGTALCDAVGRAINEAGERLSKLPEDQRPGLVVFVITTDGEENSSVEFTKQRVKAMIEHQTETYKWQFTFLGAGIDAFAEAGAIGIAAAGVSPHAPSRTKQAYASLSANVGRMRSASAGGQQVQNTYTPEEREAMNPKP